MTTGSGSSCEVISGCCPAGSDVDPAPTTSASHGRRRAGAGCCRRHQDGEGAITEIVYVGLGFRV